MQQFAKRIFVVWMVSLFAIPTLAHGVRIDHARNENTGEITVTAVFDTGEVLDHAAIIIFSPDDIVNPWKTDTLDDTGSYTFIPDYRAEGFWDIQVRKAGHGGLIHIEITQDMKPEDAPDVSTVTGTETQSTLTLSDGSQITITGDANFQVDGDIIISATGDIQQADEASRTNDGSGNGFTPAQILIMSVSIIWGCIGTALYFSRRKSTPA